MQPAAPTITPEMLEQNPLVALALSAFSVLFLALLTGSLVSWTYLAMRYWRGLPILSIEAWVPRVWGLADLMVVGAIVVGCQVIFASVGMRLLGIDPQEVPGKPLPVTLTTLVSFGNVVAVGLGTLWIAQRFQVGIGHVGFRLQGLGRHIVIGLTAGLACLPLVYLLMAAVSLGFKSEYQHPLLDEMKRSATLVSYLLGAITAVLFAPLAEEFLFRVVIQGWLQSWPFRSLRQIVWGSLPAPEDRPPKLQLASEDGATKEAIAEMPVEAAIVDDGDGYDQSGSAALLLDSENTLVAIPPIWPSIVTGILFGLAHWGYGLSFIPLIVLGVILGLLYRATHSIWPCLIVHMMLNASSMLGLGITILLERVS